MKNKSFFILGTDTDVGKTFITCALHKALSQNHFKTCSLKPIQTGCVLKNNKLQAPDVILYEEIGASEPPLYTFSLASSPHLAAKKEKKKINKKKVVEYCQKFTKKNDFTLIEGAGGIFVPINEKETLLDIAKELMYPVVLVCANKLGMLNHALLSVKALEDSGLTIACIVINHTHNKYDVISEDNIKFLQKKIPQIPLINIPFFDTCKDFSQRVSLASAIFLKKSEIFMTKESHIDMDFDKEHIWHPYTSASNPLKSYLVTRTQGNYIYIDGQKVLDGMSSWWCAIHGYNNDFISSRAIKQIQIMPHVMFGGLSHACAIDLAKDLLKIIPLDYVFYCDSGSVSVEVAMKMALQYQQAKKRKNKTKFLTPLGGYHGDTFGAMSVCDPYNGMHHLFSNTLAKQIFIQRPACPYGEKFDENSLNELEKCLHENHQQIAALILEPIVQGAGGMWIYHPKYLQNARKLCDKYEVLLICDEIATGFGRTGEMFACNHAKIIPDIMCIGKALTGGYMSFAATLASKKVAHTISSDGGVFMHGPTFMANPLACVIAKASIEFLLKNDWKKRVKTIEKILQMNLLVCKEDDAVKDVRVLGAIGVIEMKKTINVEKIQDFFLSKKVWIRPFNKLLYIMPPFTLSKKEIKKLCDVLCEAITTKRY